MTQKKVQIEGIQFCYFEITCDKPKQNILFLHGWGGSKNSLLSLGQKIGFENDRLIWIDLPGFGESDNPNSDAGVFEYTKLVEKFCQKMEINNNLIIVGHSFGGSIGLLLDEKLLKIQKKILIAPAWSRNQEKKNAGWGFLKPMFSKTRLIKRIVYKILYPKSDLFLASHLESNFRKIIHEDLRDYIKVTEVPKLLISGSLDTYVPLEKTKELSDLLGSSASFKNVGKYGHSLPLTQVDLIAPIISNFLQN